MRLMSFFLTTEQVRAGTKTVTRRLGWGFLRPGDLLMACVKCQGLKKGEAIERIRPIRVVSTRWEPVAAITKEDVAREGFPDMTPAGFVEVFCREMGVGPDTLVNRIEFEHVELAEQLDLFD